MYEGTHSFQSETSMKSSKELEIRIFPMLGLAFFVCFWPHPVSAQTPFTRTYQLGGGIEVACCAKGPMSWGFTPVIRDTSLSGNVQITSVAVSDSGSVLATDRNGVAGTTWEIFIGASPCGFPAGELQGSVSLTTYSCSSSTASTQLIFNTNTVFSGPVPQSGIFSASENFITNVFTASDIGQFISGTTTASNVTQGLYLQVLLWGGDVGADLKVSNISVTVTGTAGAVQQQLQCGKPTGQLLDFTPSGDFGTIGQSEWAWSFSPQGGTPPYRFSLASGAANIPGFRIDTAPDAPNWIPAGEGTLFGQAPVGAAANTPFTTQVEVTDCAGISITHPVTVRFSPIDFNIQWMPSQVSEEQAFSIPLTGIGGTPPYSIALVAGSLPPGVALNTATNAITGTPASGSAGLWSFTLRISDAGGSSFERGYGMNVITLGVTSPRLVIGKVGQNLNWPVVVSGGTPPYHCSLDVNSGLPSGFSIDPTCAITGTPTYELDSVWGFSIDVIDSAPIPNRALFRFNARVMGASPQPLMLAPRYESAELIPSATRGEYYQDQAAVVGGVPPWSCALAPGSSLPSGVSLFDLSAVDSLQDYEGCFLVGSVFAPGDYGFTVRVTDSVGNYGDFPATWHVSPLAVWNRYPPYGSNIPYLNKSYSQALLVSGGTPPYTITPLEPYPVDLTIGVNDPDAVLTGKVLEAGYGMPLDFEVRDSVGNTLTNDSLTQALAAPGILTLLITNGPEAAAITGRYYANDLDVFGPVHNPPYTVLLLADPTGPQPTRTTLPAGLTLVTPFTTPYDTNAVARIEGTPTEAGDFSYLLSIKDAAGNVGQRAISMHVAAAGVSIDVSADVKITSTAFAYNRKTKTFTGAVTVANTSAMMLNGPLSVVLTALTPGVAALNPSGSTASGPYYTFDVLPLAPGKSASFGVEFTDASNARIDFTPKTYSGAPR
jgi:hypothetical protein